MDNEFSQPSLKLPEIPSDFEHTAGSSRVDFAKAMWELLRQATIIGINASNPTSYDLTVLQQKVATLEANPPPKMRAVVKTGVAPNATMTCAFPDIGTNNYFVNVEAIAPEGDIATVTWAVIENSKTTNEVKIRIDGTPGIGIQFLVTIIENRA